ncbi:MAG TPA: citryl-CoA lyase [Pilimelia sp.]|nr:citryl-CoA lyase [Pilimelia sp.]
MTATDLDAVTGWWATGITDIEPGRIALRGYPIESLIGEVSWPEMVWLLLRGDLPAAHEARLLEAALVAAVDHGPQAPSIAAARMAATCGLGLNSAVATGVNLLGDVHGGAGQQCMELLQRLADAADAVDGADGADATADVTDAADAADRAEVADGAGAAGAPLDALAAAEIARYRAAGGYVPGFGHRFHPRDPRRDPLLDLVQAQVDAGLLAGRHLRAALAVEQQLARRRDRPVPMNIDGATAVIYGELGFPPELGRGLFVLSRSVGILAHAWEERERGGRIKGPLPPPLLPRYTGPPRRPVPEPDEDG